MDLGAPGHPPAVARGDLVLTPAQSWAGERGQRVSPERRPGVSEGCPKGAFPPALGQFHVFPSPPCVGRHIGVLLPGCSEPEARDGQGPPGLWGIGSGTDVPLSHRSLLAPLTS